MAAGVESLRALFVVFLHAICKETVTTAAALPAEANFRSSLAFLIARLPGPSFDSILSHSSNAADLTVLSVLPRARDRNVKSKAALES
jgi:hypothetical protein